MRSEGAFVAGEKNKKLIFRLISLRCKEKRIYLHCD
nr:MAG TPA: hypothetical protein [Caudoviricetes sp.]